MKTNVFLYAIFVFFFQNVNAFTFNSLSKDIPVVFKNDIDEKLRNSENLIESNVILNINKNYKDSIVFIKIEFLLDGEILTDYYKVYNQFDDTIKKFILKSNQQLELKIYLNDKYIKKKEVDGSIIFYNKKYIIPEPDYIQHEFTGNYWYFKNTPLLKFSKDNNKKYNLKIRFYFSESYLYDNLLLSFKTISPEEGILEWEEKILVNEDDYLSFQKKIIEVFIEKINVERQGFYYIQCKQVMWDLYLNGIIKVDYEFVESKNNN